MRKVGGLVRVMADQLEAGLTVAQNDNFAADRYEWNEWVRPKAALAGDCDLSGAVVFKRGLDLCARCVELAASPLNLPAERAEPIGIKTVGQYDLKAQAAFEQRANDPLLAMHGGQDRALAHNRKPGRNRHLSDSHQK